MEITEVFIDITVLEPHLKHPAIFARFDELKSGESLIIHNDHDPKPVYYQLLGERGNTIKWEYLEQGPEVWEVRLTKNTPEAGESIGELVAKDYRKAQVFKKFGLDFCCGGKKSVRTACEEKGLDADKVERELNALTKEPVAKAENYDKWDLGFLADYIVNKHHVYVRETLPTLTEYTTKIARVHGDRHPELVEVARHFTAVANELTAHMPKEERVLFPYIKQLATAHNNNEILSPPAFGTIQNPVNMMEMEHEAAGNSIAAIRSLTDNYTLPADACATYRVAFAKLQEFEDDLFNHIHLENNILFPKAIEMEKDMFV